MKILVSGATGFLGSNITKKLKLNHKVMILTRKKKSNQKNVIQVQCDLNIKESYIKKIKNFQPELFLHLAWEGIPNFNISNCNKNIRISKNIIGEVIKIKACKKIIVSGSCLEYDSLVKRAKENSKLNYKNNFSKAKIKLYKWINKKIDKTNISFSWVRIFYVYGNGQRAGSLIPTLLKNLKENKKIDVKYPNNNCDFIHIDDVVRFFMLIITKKFKSGIYNLGTGKNTKLIKICKLILKKKFKELYILPKNNIKPKSNFWADMSKTRKMFNYKTNILIEKGIKDLIKNND